MSRIDCSFCLPAPGFDWANLACLVGVGSQITRPAFNFSCLTVGRICDQLPSWQVLCPVQGRATSIRPSPQSSALLLPCHAGAQWPPQPICGWFSAPPPLSLQLVPSSCLRWCQLFSGVSGQPHANYRTCQHRPSVLSSWALCCYRAWACLCSHFCSLRAPQNKWTSSAPSASWLLLALSNAVLSSLKFERLFRSGVIGGAHCGPVDLVSAFVLFWFLVFLTQEVFGISEMFALFSLRRWIFTEVLQASACSLASLKAGWLHLPHREVCPWGKGESPRVNGLASYPASVQLVQTIGSVWILWGTYLPVDPQDDVSIQPQHFFFSVLCYIWWQVHIVFQGQYITHVQPNNALWWGRFLESLLITVRCVLRVFEGFLLAVSEDVVKTVVKLLVAGVQDFVGQRFYQRGTVGLFLAVSHFMKLINSQ